MQTGRQRSRDVRSDPDIQLPVPEIYVKMEEILAVCKAGKRTEQETVCTIPFDHTLEAGAMGGNVRYGNETAGPRAEKPICQSLEELKAISGMDFDSGRMKETLDVCRELRKQGGGSAVSDVRSFDDLEYID